MPVNNDEGLRGGDSPKARAARKLAEDASRYGTERRELVGTMEFGWKTVWSDPPNIATNREYKYLHPQIRGRDNPSNTVTMSHCNGSGKDYSKMWVVVQFLSIYNHVMEEDWDIGEIKEKSIDGFVGFLPRINQYLGGNSYDSSVGGGSWEYVNTTYALAVKGRKCHYLYNVALDMQQADYPSTARPMSMREGFVNCYQDTSMLSHNVDASGTDFQIWDTAVIEMDIGSGFEPDQPFNLKLQMTNQHKSFNSNGIFADYPQFKDDQLPIYADLNGDPDLNRMETRLFGFSLWAQ